MKETELQIGISSCLLGESVRFNGGHAHNEFLTKNLGRFVEWIPVCPEVETGMGVPRPAVRLTGNLDNPSLINSKTAEDWTDRMQTWSSQFLENPKLSNLAGFIFKKDSPSCGLFRVRIYGNENVASRKGRGIFSKKLTTALPLMPVEEEGRLNDHRLRDNFVERIFAYHRWKTLLNSNPSPLDLMEFHGSHKMTLMAHHPQLQRELGKIAARLEKRTLEETLNSYGMLFMKTLSYQATNKKHANVLQHILGYLKKSITSDDKAELLDLIDDYRLELNPLIVPITLLKHHLGKNSVPSWLLNQTYLNPYPKELLLRNHV